MPELPELEVLGKVLSEKIIGIRIESVIVRQPLVFRCLIEDFQKTLTGSRFTKIYRRGKFLLFETDQEKELVINFMLTGRLQLTESNAKLIHKTCFQIGFENDQQLRYFDQKHMGRIYFESEDNLAVIPQFATLGSEPLEASFTFEVFQAKFKKYFGMIKNVITNQEFITGIGNAYSDEILFQAGILPLKKASQLSPEERLKLFEAIKSVLTQSINTIASQIGEDIHIQKRDFMLIHNRGGSPCPVCGTKISELKPDGRITNFCRTCQK